MASAHDSPHHVRHPKHGWSRAGRRRDLRSHSGRGRRRNRCGRPTACGGAASLVHDELDLLDAGRAWCRLLRAHCPVGLVEHPEGSAANWFGLKAGILDVRLREIKALTHDVRHRVRLPAARRQAQRDASAPTRRCGLHRRGLSVIHSSLGDRIDRFEKLPRTSARPRSVRAGSVAHRERSRTVTNGEENLQVAETSAQAARPTAGIGSDCGSDGRQEEVSIPGCASEHR
jgi:hypothetical protein